MTEPVDPDPTNDPTDEVLPPPPEPDKEADDPPMEPNPYMGGGGTPP